MDVRYGVSVEEFAAYVTDLGLDHVELKREYLEGHPDAPTPAEMRDIAERYDLSVTYHAPFRDWNLGSFNEEARRGSVDRVKKSLDDAAAAGAGAVVVHGGSVPRRYPEWVRETAAENAVRSLAECAAHAERVGVPLCLENQPRSDEKRRYTTTPEDLAGLLSVIPVGADSVGVTLDVGHAEVNDVDWERFVDRFGDRIRVCHLHDNDGTGDDHLPLTDYENVVEAVPADYCVFEMKSVDDVARCLGVERPAPERSQTGR
jgi:sugar phosphate isomerase/epimerase